jgi:NNP family nitrate/nitrite transporter-like MFS transporter
MCQYWTCRMFTRDVAGTANALVGGWENLGGVDTQLVMGSLLLPLFNVLFGDSSMMTLRKPGAQVPAVVAFVTSIIIYFISDDAPKGNYVEVKKHGATPEISVTASFRSGAINFNTWILFLLQYGCAALVLSLL